MGGFFLSTLQLWAVFWSPTLQLWVFGVQTFRFGSDLESKPLDLELWYLDSRKNPKFIFKYLI
ncbi:MAG: hypothetical protein KAI83_08305 [Thiomargarita sp.]|nr:hypothetical protein [Thiomargarita sp.]